MEAEAVWKDGVEPEPKESLGNPPKAADGSVTPEGVCPLSRFGCLMGRAKAPARTKEHFYPSSSNCSGG